jgi:acetoin utilization deacetylase AcuC-like enzyme
MRIFTDERCFGHPAPPGFPEMPERLRGLLAELDADPKAAVVRLAGDAATAERALAAIARVHSAELAGRLERATLRGDSLFDTADNPIGRGSFDAALAAVETTLAALAEAIERPGGAGAGASPVFAAVRPPGHHAERDRAMGFCFFGNVAVAARAAQERHGLARVAIYDFDVHHGNGTQHLFEDDPTVLYVSVHQSPFYPGTGAAGERGVGAGVGATVNVPLPAGSDDAVYERAWRETVLPALARFEPDLLLVSAGFDAWRSDPLGGMRVTADGFADWGRWLAGFAREACGGRMLSVLEGGYDLGALPTLVRRYLEGAGAESSPR